MQAIETIEVRGQPRSRASCQAGCNARIVECDLGFLMLVADA
jgi:hypothetical protein